MAEPLDPAAIKSLHQKGRWSNECAGCRADCMYCEGDHPWPCATYQLAVELEEAQATILRSAEAEADTQLLVDEQQTRAEKAEAELAELQRRSRRITQQVAATSWASFPRT